MKKLLSLLAIILAGGSFMLHAAAKGIPKTFHGNWIDTTTNLWALSLWDGFAAADASLWDYEKWSGNGKTARATLRRADGTQRKFRFELRNDSTLVMTGADGRHVLLRESLTTAQRPFTASGRDTSSFRSMLWVDDSIRVEGFITGYKPGDAVYHYWLPELFGFGAPHTPMNTDSLGRFSVTIPSTHEQIHIVGTDIAAGPGDRIFIGYSSEGKRHLFMGDNARVNQELNDHRPFRVARHFLPPPDPNERISDPMSWRYLRASAGTIALMATANYCREHNLSRKTQQAICSAIKFVTIAEIAMMPDKHPYLGLQYRYYLPERWLDYSDPELFFYSANHALLYPFLFFWRSYVPMYIADLAGLRGKDRETYLYERYFSANDPKRWEDFMERNRSHIDSIYQTMNSEKFVQQAIIIADTMVPAGGWSHDIIFAQGLAKLWSANEEPFSEEAMTLIDSVLCEAPFLRDSLRGLNDRYRILAERNAALEIPKGKIDSTLSQPDSILAAILRPYQGETVCMIFVQPGDAAADKELRHIPTIREKYENAAIRFILVSDGLAPLKWRNTIAEYGLIGEHTVHYELTSPQIQALLQKYWNGSGFFLLFDRTGKMAAGPAPKPSDGDKLLERIDELLAR